MDFILENGDDAILKSLNIGGVARDELPQEFSFKNSTNFRAFFPE